MKKIIPISKPEIGEKEKKNVLKCLKSGWISGAIPDGGDIAKFEKSFTNYLGGGYGVAVSNGTVAIQLALKTFNIGPGDEVIVPDITFAATINAVINSGVTPVLVDIERDTWTIDLKEIEKAITKRTKAIIPVHYAGISCQMDELSSMGITHNIKIIEDAAQGIGATYKNRPLGTIGDIGCLFFHDTKNISCGEGGAIFINDTSLKLKAEIIREKGTNCVSYLLLLMLQ